MFVYVKQIRIEKKYIRYIIRYSIAVSNMFGFLKAHRIIDIWVIRSLFLDNTKVFSLLGIAYGHDIVFMCIDNIYVDYTNLTYVTYIKIIPKRWIKSSLILMYLTIVEFLKKLYCPYYE